MKRTLIAFALSACSFQASAQNAAVGCLVEPSEVVELGSPVIGLVERIYVERGDTVREGQVLAQLQADVERTAVSVAHTRAHRDAELESAASAHELAKRKQERSESLFQAKFISNQLRDEARTEAQLAEARLKQAREQRRQAHRELEFARSQLALRTIKSPLYGVVVERYLARGERAEEKPILRLASLNPLKVEVIMPVSEFEKIRLGTQATVALQLPSAPQREAKVTHIDRVMDAASNTFRVRLSLPNPDFQLPAGVHCKVAFGVGAESEQSSSAREKVSAMLPAAASKSPAAGASQRVALRTRQQQSASVGERRLAPVRSGASVTAGLKLTRALDRVHLAAAVRTGITIAVKSEDD